MRALSFALAVVAGLSLSLVAYAGEEENPEDFMQLHNIEITFHKAGSTKDVALMLSLFADDAVLTAKGKTYTGKDQIKSYWQAHPAFQPQAQWVGYTPAIRIDMIAGRPGPLVFRMPVGRQNGRKDRRAYQLRRPANAGQRPLAD